MVPLGAESTCGNLSAPYSVTPSMRTKHSQRQGTARDLFGVTARPHLRTYTALEAVGARAGEAWVREAGPTQVVGLNGQEFLLFRGLGLEADLDSFARTYGLLGLSSAAGEQVRVKTNLRPAWARALTMPPDHYRPRAEPVADWLRQAGLMDTALGCWGLLGSPPARRTLVSACRKLRPAAEAPALDHQAEIAASSSSWPVRSILGGSAAAGLRVARAGSRGSGSRTEVDFHPSSWRRIWSRRAGREIRPSMRMELSTVGISEFLLWRFVNPWLGRVHASLMAEKRQIIPTYVLPGDLLGILWMQFANALLTSVNPRVCGWERCPGPPERPGVFLWRWGRTETGSKHRDAMYCHPKCQHAAAVDRSRRSPGSLQRRRR